MNLIKFVNNIFYKQYELRIEDYIFRGNEDVKIVFKLRFSRNKLNVPLHEVVNNENYISKIHPYDCYIIGILNRMLLEKIPFKNKNTLKIKHNNEKILPCIHFSGFNCKNKKLTFELNKSKTKYNITIDEFIHSRFILRGLPSVDSLQVGFIITDYLMNDGILNLNG